MRIAVWAALLLSVPPALAGKPVAADAVAPLPAFSFRDLSGEVHTLGDFHGKVVLLDLWATWCGPCMQALPVYDAWQVELGGAGLQVIALSVDEHAAPVERFARQRCPNVLVALDADHSAAEALKPPGMPTSWLIGRDGSVVARFEGYRPGDKDAEKALIEQELAK